MTNSHPQPEFVDARGVKDTLAAGVSQTGGSGIVVDSGSIIAQERVPVHAGDTEHSLHDRIKLVERGLLVGCCSTSRTGLSTSSR